jgi:uncharacterized metal-binding protein YceD (DUF177 family)
MKIQVDQILNRDFIEIAEMFSEIELLEGVRLAEPIIFRGNLRSMENDEIGIDDKLSVKLVIKCIRCLDSFVENINIKILETYYSLYRVDGTPNGDEFSNLSHFTNNNKIIDLDEIIRDNLVAAIPPYPL